MVVVENIILCVNKENLDLLEVVEQEKYVNTMYFAISLVYMEPVERS